MFGRRIAKRSAGRDGDVPSRRRFLATAGTVGAAVGLAGCTLGGANPTGTTVVQLSASTDEQSIQPVINDTLHEVGIPSDMRVEILPTTSDIARSQYSQWLSAGLEQPSLLRMDSGWTLPFVLREQIVNLERALPDVADRMKAEVFDASLATATGPDGDLHAVPLFADFGLMLYRKDLVEQAGYDPGGWATNPLSWREFSRAVADARAEAATDYGFTFQARIGEGLSCCIFTELMCSWGGSYFGPPEYLLGPVGERPVTVDGDPAVRANRMVRQFVHGDDGSRGLPEFAGSISPNAVFSWGVGSSLGPFTDGAAVAVRNWPFAVRAAGGEDAFGEDLGVMPIPYGVQPGEAAVDGMGGSVSALGGWHVALNPNARYPEAAKQVLRGLSTDEFGIMLLRKLGYLPPKPGLLDSQQARDVDVMGRYINTIRYAGEHAVPRPVTVAWPMESPRIAQQVSAAFTREKRPERAMADLASILTDIEESIAQRGTQNGN